MMNVPRLDGEPPRERGRPRAEGEAAYHVPKLPSSTTVSRKRRKFILCFDGTGNKFQGTEADSNILKIYRMLDRSDGNQFHYYQPGIGTYVAGKSLSDTGLTARIKSWYAKAKDSAVGTYFGDHVMAGYKFLMRYYQPGDDIYMFGFSRGAYTARFLAEMLDSVGLLSQGNEEMARFAWKTFQKWQVRQDSTPEERQQKTELLEFMFAFRETFSRPIRRIRFLGLFDTVNSVPTFENAFLDRNSRFPYTARSQAKVIRHAVAIDERRAKFRQDLVGASRMQVEAPQVHWFNTHWHHRRLSRGKSSSRGASVVAEDRGRPPTREDEHGHLAVPAHTRFHDQSEVSGVRSRSRRRRHEDSEAASLATSIPVSESAYRRHEDDADSEDEDATQDIDEVWFSGCHADIGGGWPIGENEHKPLSHVPLVWMVHEARRAGLNFDEGKLRALNCYPHDDDPAASWYDQRDAVVPAIAIQEQPPSPGDEPVAMNGITDNSPSAAPTPASTPSRFRDALESASERGRMHDVLLFNNGISAGSVISWKIMEYMPFRRMDLQPDGSWKSIIWPLPKGETRDVPADAHIHHSVLRRMAADETYRPGNLICGGGGRGVRTAPKEFGTGKWRVQAREGDWVREVHVRAEPPKALSRAMSKHVEGGNELGTELDKSKAEKVLGK